MNLRNKAYLDLAVANWQINHLADLTKFAIIYSEVMHAYLGFVDPDPAVGLVSFKTDDTTIDIWLADNPVNHTLNGVTYKATPPPPTQTPLINRKYTLVPLPPYPTGIACDHTWSHYQGIMKSYDFCTKCDAKQNET